MSNSAYSPIEHMASAIFFDQNKESVHMAMFTAYFDASGQQHDEKVLTIAGYVSSVEKWNKLMMEWKDVLQHEGVRSLHMKNFIHSTEEYEGWKGDKARRDRFMSALVDIIKRRVHKGFACVVNLKDYREINAQFDMSERWGNPYAFAGYSVVSLAEKWKRNRFPNEPVRYFFESGDPGQNELRILLEKDGETPHFEPKFNKKTHEYFHAFEPADLLAWEIGYASKQYMDDTLLDFRGAWKELEKVPSEWILFEGSNLQRMCSELATPRMPLKL